jgi:hypothetical protein
MANAKSKRDMLRDVASGRRRTRTSEEREDMRVNLLGPENPVRKALFVLDVEDLEWLDSTVTQLKRKRRKTNKSELMRLGIALMKRLSEEELRQQLRELD